VPIPSKTPEITWRDLEIAAYGCTFILSISCLILIYLGVFRRCMLIFLLGDDCGVGLIWFVLAAAVVGTGIYSAWLLYLMEKERGDLPLPDPSSIPKSPFVFLVRQPFQDKRNQLCPVAGN